MSEPAPATSLADFYKKAETDERYQDAAIRAYVSYFSRRESWQRVRAQLDDWAESNVGSDLDCDCARMVNYLNMFVRNPDKTS